MERTKGTAVAISTGEFKQETQKTNMNEITTFGIGTALLALGAVAFLIMGRSESAEKQHHYVTAFFIAAVAAISYLAMTMGQGHVTVQDVTGPREFYYARYLDWSITTPLLLLSLGLVALTHLHERGTLLSGVIGADILMIVTGLFAGLSAGFAKWMWFTVSCGAFIAVLVLIWGALRTEADKQPQGYGALYGKMTGLLTLLWFAYPIVFIIGTEGVRAISPSLETLIFMVLDVTAKIVFSFLLLSATKALASRAVEQDVRPDVLTAQSGAAQAGNIGSARL